MSVNPLDAAEPQPEPVIEIYDDRYTLCHDCGAQFYPDEEGFDYENCFDCGGFCDTYGDFDA
jgi:hypothetical protein